MESQKKQNYVGNLTTETIAKDITELLGLNSTTFLRQNSKTQVHFNSKSKFKGYAIVEVFTDIAEQILSLNGFEYNFRKLVTETT